MMCNNDEEQEQEHDIIETIMGSYLNGQFAQMSRQIDRCGAWVFWKDLINHLREKYGDVSAKVPPSYEKTWLEGILVVYIGTGN